MGTAPATSSNCDRTDPAAATAAWPDEPYKGLAYYGPGDVPLFTGRAEDIAKCVHYLADASTKILILHGQSGCGKSSFLRAGLIPSLEKQGLAYLFLRTDSADGGGESPVFIRCGSEPVSRIAEAVYAFCSKLRMIKTTAEPPPPDPPRVTTEPPAPITVLTPIDLSEVLGNCTTAEAFVAKYAEPSALLERLQLISETLPYTLVLVLDQVEEVITLETAKSTGKQCFVDFMHEVVAASLDVKLVLALRKEYFGELFGLIQFDASLVSDIKQFLLADLKPEQVKAAILLPTLSDVVCQGLKPPTPYERYAFRFESGLPDTIVSDLFRATPSGGALPVMQIVCRDLYNAVKDRPEPKIIDTGLYRVGNGVAGCVDRHISRSLREALRSAGTTGKLDADETSWRLKLWSLVKRSPDGTAKSDLVSEAHFASNGADGEIESTTLTVLSSLSSPGVLVLRRFSGLLAGTGRHVTQYSLGHDAIALALSEWKIGDDRLRDELAAQKHRRFRTRLYTAAILLLLCTSVWWITGRHRDAESLVSTATRNQRKDVVLALTALATSIHESHWSFGRTNARDVLTGILGRLPISCWSGGAKAFPIHQPHRVLFWDGNVGIDVVDPLTLPTHPCASGDLRMSYGAKSSKQAITSDHYALTVPLPPLKDRVPMTLSAQTAGQGVIIVSMWPNDSSLWKRGKLFVLRNHRAELISDDTPAANRVNRTDSISEARRGANVALTDDVVFFIRQNVLDTSYEPFVVRQINGTIDFSSGDKLIFPNYGQKSDPLAPSPLWVTNGRLLVALGYDPLSATAPLGILQQVDLHTGKAVWEFDSRNSAQFAECKAVDASPRCSIVTVGTPRDLSFFALNILKIAGGSQLSDNSESSAAANPTWLMLVDATAVNADAATSPAPPADTVRVDWSNLYSAARSGPLPQIDQQAQAPSPTTQAGGMAFVDGDVGDINMGLAAANSIDLVHISRDGSVTYVGTILDTGDVTYWMVLQKDKQTFVVGTTGDGLLKEWRLGADETRATLGDDEDMIRSACAAIGNRTVNPDAWSHEMGTRRALPGVCSKK